MRPGTAAKLDKLHASIATLIESEKAWQRKHLPQAPIRQQVADCAIEMHRLPPKLRGSTTP